MIEIQFKIHRDTVGRAMEYFASYVSSINASFMNTVMIVTLKVPVGDIQCVANTLRYEFGDLLK